MRIFFVFISVCILILVGVTLSFCTYYGSIYFDWRQKITVVVQTPDGDVEGASVQQVIVEKARNKLGFDGADFKAKIVGEAVVVELPNGMNLFLLLSSADAIGGADALLPRILSPKIGWGSMDALTKAADEPLNSKYLLPEKLIPSIVTFTDIKDPRSVTRVMPSNLAATFGEGYSLKSVTLETTDKTVTEGRIEKMLGWVGDENELKRIWSVLSGEQHDLLSSRNWRSGD